MVKVNLLKTETSWATRVAIAGRKQAINLDISAVLPSEAADNFLMHLRDRPAGPDETDALGAWPRDAAVDTHK